MPPIYHAFASEVFSARTRKGLTQEQLANQLNISPRWYQKIEKGECSPNLATIINLLVFLEIDVQVFNKDKEVEARE